MATALVGDSGAPEGVVLVLDDVTPLIRAQKVAAWREVARRLAHEIKNPLTPIQLSRRAAAPSFRRRAAGSQGAGRRMHHHHRRRGRVAEGAGRRVLAVRADAGAADGADRSGAAHHRHAGALQRPVHRRPHRAAVRRRACRWSGSTPSRSAASSSTWSTTRSKRWSAAARSSSRPSSTAPTASSRVIVADDGPGIPAGGARQAVPAVLLDQAPRQRPRPGDRPPHHRRARRQHRRRRQHAARHAFYHRAAVLTW